MAEKKIKKIDPKVIEKFETALLSNTAHTEAKKEQSLEENSKEANSSDSKKESEAEKNQDISLEDFQKKLDEANFRFLNISKKLHILEEENKRLIDENNVLKSQCNELETRNSELEDNIFNSNIEISEKLSKIVELETTIENMKKKVFPNSGFVMGGNTVVGMNGYESWN